MSTSISIVIPNFNSGPVLERAIQSLIAQQYPNLQIILIDAGSTDASREIIERYRHIFDTVIIEKDHGQADAINKGFSHARGEIFGWLCADDELLSGALQQIAEKFTAEPSTDVVTGGCERVFADGARTLVPANPNSWQIVNAQNPIEQSATFWRASLHRKVGPLTLQYQLAFDWDLWNRFQRAGATLATISPTISRYYFSNTNKTGNAGRLFADEAFSILRRYGPMMGLLAYIFRFLYFHFDLKGCYDKPPTCTLLRSHLFIWTLAALRLLIGKRLLYLYNWHFAAAQERGLKWW
jgi:glycosyltransferase involved in cell wall biosynthesis